MERFTDPMTIALALAIMAMLVCLESWVNSRRKLKEAADVRNALVADFATYKEANSTETLQKRIEELEEFIDRNPALSLAWQWKCEAMQVDKAYSQIRQRIHELEEKFYREKEHLNTTIRVHEQALQLAAETNARLAEENIKLANNSNRSGGRTVFAD